MISVDQFLFVIRFLLLAFHPRYLMYSMDEYLLINILIAYISFYISTSCIYVSISSFLHFTIYEYYQLFLYRDYIHNLITYYHDVASIFVFLILLLEPNNWILFNQIWKCVLIILLVEASGLFVFVFIDNISFRSKSDFHPDICVRFPPLIFVCYLNFL